MTVCGLTGLLKVLDTQFIYLSIYCDWSIYINSFYKSGETQQQVATGSSWRNMSWSIYLIISLFHRAHLLFGFTAGNNKQWENVLYAKHPSGGISILISLQQLPSYFHELLTCGRDNAKTVEWMELLPCDG